MLTGKQRSFLRAMGNTIEPIMQLGKNGIDDNFLNQIEEALEARELVKITVLRNSMYDTREACEQICRAIDADPVQVIGNRFIVYKKSREKSRIVLPAQTKTNNRNTK